MYGFGDTALKFQNIRCLISITQTYVSTIYLFYSMATCFAYMLVIFRPLHLLYQMLINI